jgi:energy-coupling factor transporter ATP-binding protein EcfA2
VSSLSASERTAISVEDVSVTYRTSLERAPTLRSTVLKLGRREKIVREIEAVRGVSFDVPHGTVLGIVGANGAGKSTLVRTIAGILPPSSGRVEVHGRVSTLLALGVGFNKNLSGRDNGSAASRPGSSAPSWRRSTTTSSSSPSSSSSWTCRCGPTRRACTGAWRSRSR